MKKIIIAVAGVAVLAGIIIVAVLYFGKFGGPRTVVLKAAAKTIGEFGSGVTLPPVNEIMAGQYRQDIAVGINKLGGDALKDVDASLLAVLQLFTFKDSARYDPALQKRQDTLSVQLAVTPLAEATIISEPSQIAVSAPLLFDYFVTFDPSKYVSEWDNSVLGRSAGAVWDPAMESVVYEAYKSLLFPERTAFTENPFNLELYTAILDDEIEYNYIGKETVTDGAFTKRCDLYRVTVPGSAVVSLLNAVVSDLSKIGAILAENAAQIISQLGNADINLDVYLADGKVAVVTIGDSRQLALYFTGDDINLEKVHAVFITGDISFDAQLEMQMREEDTVIIDCAVTAQSAGDVTTFDFNLHWNDPAASGGNFMTYLNVTNAGDNITFAANGDLDAADDRVELDLDSVTLNTDIGSAALEADFSLELNIRADSSPIDAAGDIRSLSSVTEMDVLDMYLKLLSDPQIGALLNF
jgi:hypothetical protein